MVHNWCQFVPVTKLDYQREITSPAVKCSCCATRGVFRDFQVKIPNQGKPLIHRTTETAVYILVAASPADITLLSVIICSERGHYQTKIALTLFPLFWKGQTRLYVFRNTNRPILY